jgi:hypothetical protein
MFLQSGYKSNRRLTGSLALVLALFGISAPLTGCSSGGASGTSPGQSADSVALSLSNATITVPAGGSIGRVTARVTRSNSSGSINLTVSGMPAGSMINYDQQPGTGNTGIIALNPGTAVEGTYSLTVQASDGVANTSATCSFVIGAGIAAKISTPITWSSTAPLISAVSDATHDLLAVKDPTVVYYNNAWSVYTTTVDTGGNYNMAYFNFPDWSNASAAKPYYMDQTPGFSGYHCAPEVFYFTPQNKWYLIFQSGQPQYSTTSDPTQPSTWSEPQNFFAAQPANVSNWIDFWVICDSVNCYLFFAGDNGILYRSQTSISSFPQGFGTPVIVMQAANQFDLFESDNVYNLKGLNQYLTIIEALGPTGNRYYRAFISSSLDGDLTPLDEANSWQYPYAGINNVSFASGVTPWTNDISHGEMLRDGYDETLTIDPANLQFLYQGVEPADSSVSYAFIPWQLGILTRSN